MVRTCRNQALVLRIDVVMNWVPLFPDKKRALAATFSVFVSMASSITSSGEIDIGSRGVPPVEDFPQSRAQMITGGPFELISHTGERVTDQDFNGSFLLIFFGYTHCPDVCPNDLAVMGQAVELLGEQADRVQPLFITFDPVRDTEQRLADYVQNFHPRMIGLTGTREQSLAAAEHYGVDVSATYQADVPGSAYSMNHSAFTYLVGPRGELRVMFRDGTGPELMAGVIRKHLQR